MPGPDADGILTRLAALPAAAPLLERLGETPDVYLVGGAVRDLLLGGSPVDLDLVVDGELGPVTARLGPPARAHDRFETGTVVVDGYTYDLARARREAYAHPGALPAVAPAPIEVDLLRRDFTVNALAIGIGGETRGRLLEVPGGLADLRARRLRVLHAASFTDDPTRLLRLARYASRLGFSVEDDTRELAAQAVAGRATDTVSGSRLGAELRLLAAEPDPVGALRALSELGIDELLAPGFGIRTEATAQTAERALGLLPADCDRGAVALAAAMLGLDPAEREQLLDRLAFPAGQRDVILAAADGAPALSEALAAARTPSAIAATVRGAPVELVALAGALGAPEQARRWLDDLRHVRLEIDGQDLLDAGVRQGPAVGAGLARALAAKLDGRAAGREAELAEALRSAPDGDRLGIMQPPRPFYELGGHFAIELPGARAVFTTRRGGYSHGPYRSLNLGVFTDDEPAAVAHNRAALRADVAAPPLRFLHQVHGAEVRRVEAGDPRPDPPPKADGQATATPGVAPAALVADCLPVAVAGDGAVAMLHAGWRGLAAGIIAEGVRALRELGAEGRLAAAIGPGAGGCCYEAGAEVHQAFADVAEAFHDGAHVDLSAVARRRLSEAGVTEVADLGICTICPDPDLLFSHRRDHGLTGRQAGVAWLT